MSVCSFPDAFSLLLHTLAVNRCTRQWFLLFIYIYCYRDWNRVFGGHLFLWEILCVCVCVCVWGSQLCEWGSVMRNAYQPATACQLGAISRYPNNPTGRPRVFVLIPNISYLSLPAWREQSADGLRWLGLWEVICARKISGLFFLRGSINGGEISFFS